jgi:protein phosphatase 1 regulatory subunit 7
MSSDNKEASEKHAHNMSESSTKEAMPLDWTRVDAAAAPNRHHGDERPVRHPWDVVDINKEDTELVIVGTAGQKITHMGTNLGDYCNPFLQELILRSHLITKMEGLFTFTCLELLELYDNAIEELQCLNEGKGGAPGATLRVLDMSYNVIRSMEPVKFCPHLTELYLANNKIKSMAGLGGLSSLRKIDLGANRIRVMDIQELSGLVNLEELWLGKNKIEEIQGLEKLTKLRRLDVQSNRLVKVTNLTTQVDTLEELYLAHNGINDDGAAQATGLALHFTQLSTLDLSKNCLTTTLPFSHLTSLDDLWLSSNKICTFDAVEPLGALTSLEEVYLEYNPVADEFEYRKKLKEIIPSLIKIDANMIGASGDLPAGGQAMTKEEELRRIQEQVVERARLESNKDTK